MNKFTVILGFCLALCCAASVAQDIKASLVEKTWQLVRQTNLGTITTQYVFSSDGSGKAMQFIKRGAEEKTEKFNFTYTLSGNRITIQEEVDKQWLGYIGVSKWTFKDNKLIDDIRFRGKEIVFTPI